MEQEKPIVRPIRVIQTTPQHGDELDYVVTIPNDVDIDQYTNDLAKDLIEFLNKELVYS